MSGRERTSHADYSRSFHRLFAKRLWQDSGSPKEKAKLFLKMTLRPAWSLRETVLSLPALYPSVKQQTGMGLVRQAIRQLRAQSALHLDRESYYKYRLFERTGSGSPAKFVTHREIVTLLPLLNEAISAAEAKTLSDKTAFIDLCRKNALPVSDNLARFADGRVALFADASAFRGDLFAKPENDYCGNGLRMWRFVDSGRYASQGGAICDLDGLFAELQRQSSSGPILLQKRLHNHPDLTGLSTGALSTVRVVTCRNPDGPLEILICAYRIPTGASIGDNFALGGLAAGLDHASGTLRTAVFKDPRRSFARLTHHPDTNKPIAGVKLPFWPETLALAKQAHALVERMAFVGWDIAILENGPALIEGNEVWCVEVVQMANAQPLGETKFFEYFHRHRRAAGLLT